MPCQLFEPIEGIANSRLASLITVEAREDPILDHPCNSRDVAFNVAVEHVARAGAHDHNQRARRRCSRARYAGMRIDDGSADRRVFS